MSSWARERFARQCERLCELHDLSPRPMLEFGEDNGQLFTVRPFVPGTTLAERIQQHHLSPLETLQLAVSVCTVLHEHHTRRILHRSIKPSNIILGGKGSLETVVLQDAGEVFGKPLKPTERQARESVIYMSPEQTGIVDVDVGEPSDLYCLGILLYECLTGRPPYHGSAVEEILFQHMTAPVPELHIAGFEIPTALDQLIQRLLHKALRGRYRSATGVLHDLSQILAELERGDTNPTLILGTRDRHQTLTESAFVGRGTELATIDREIEAVQNRHRQLVLLEGASGSGKTRLLSEVALQAMHAGMWVFRGGAVTDAVRRPLQLLDGVVADFIRAATNAPALSRAVWERLGDFQDVVTEAFPTLTQELGWQAPPTDTAGGIREVRTVRGLVRFLQILGSSDRPVVIILDDCQWGDELTIKLLDCWSAMERDHDRDESRVLSDRLLSIGGSRYPAPTSAPLCVDSHQARPLIVH